MQPICLAWLFNRAFRRMIVAACALLVCAVAITNGAAAQAWCTSEKFSDYTRQLSLIGPSPAASPTGAFPAGRTAEIVFNQPLDEASRVFRVFRAQDKEGAPTFHPIEVLSVGKAKDKTEPGAVAGFLPSNSVVLRISVDDDKHWSWERQYFVVVACKGGQPVGWGAMRARVSPALTPVLICWAVLLLSYVFAMVAVYLSRQTKHPLATKYPAIFNVKKLKRGDFFNPIHLTTDTFNHASTQKLQVLMFSFLVGFLVLDLVLRTGALADLSPTIVGLLGISGVGAAAAQITYRQRTRLSFENWAWLQQSGVLKPEDSTSGPGPQWRDLVLSNREFDVYKLQTLIFSVAVAVALVVGGSTSLATFTVPETLLGILGLSQVVYVGGILVRPPAVDDLDQTLTKLRAAREKLEVAKAQGTDTDADGKLLDPPLPPGHTPAANAQRQYDGLVERVIPMIESTLEVETDKTKLQAPEKPK